MTHHADPRTRRHGAPPVDDLSAAVRLERAAEAMRARSLRSGPVDEDEPPTGLIDLAAIRAAVAAGPTGERVDPAAAAWLAGGADPVAEALVARVDALEAAPVASSPEPAPEPPLPPAAPAPVSSPVPTPAPEPAPAPEPVITPEQVDDAAAYARGAELSAAARAAFVSERGRDLGWRSRHDARSRGFHVRAAMAGSAPLTDHLWPVGPVGDQGAEGACVGWGLRDAVNAAAAGDADRTGLDAEALYRLAQRLDEVPGESYAGTSVLAGLQAARQLGWIDAYRWCFGTADVAQSVLQLGPVVVGVPWLSGMYETGPGGLVTLAGEDEGAGHCLAIVGLRMRGPQGQPGPFFVWQNSWGAAYGDGGLGYIHHRDLAALLHGAGEAALPTVAR